MARPEPATPSPQRPWYYQTWFLVAAFILGWPITLPFGVFWPVWGFLILRSPWHNHPLLKGLGWAMLVVGGVMFVRALQAGGDSTGLAVMTLIPGLLITLATQVMWARYRLENSPDAEAETLAPADDLPSDSPPPAGPSRPRRRAPRRWRTRSGRPPR